ncbi:hypothetical protein MASR2M29_09220 [Spirochaetota bacterium]
MKLNRLFWILAALAFLASCATKPPAPEPEPEPFVAPIEEVVKEPETPKEPEVSKEEVSELLNRVVALRKDAFDLGLKDLFTADYTEADAAYVSGKSAHDSDKLPEAKETLTKSEMLFSALVSKGLISVADTKKVSSGDAKERAVNADAMAWSGDIMETANAYEASAKGYHESKNFRSAIAEYNKSISAYGVAEKSALAMAEQNMVDSLDFSSMDSGNYSIALSKLELAHSSVAEDPDKALDAADEALLRFRLVKAKGWELTAGGSQKKAERYKTDSDGIKAQVAVKEQYAKAKAVWDTAMAAYNTGHFEDAVTLFNDAENLFQLVYKNASEKRQAALSAMQNAKAKSATSESIASSGDAYLQTESGDSSIRVGE